MVRKDKNNQKLDPILEDMNGKGNPLDAEIGKPMPNAPRPQPPKANADNRQFNDLSKRLKALEKKGNANNPKQGDDKNKSIDKGITFSTLNLSTGLVTSKYKNRSVIVQPYSTIKDESIVIDLTVRPIKSRLIAQASVFARKIITNQKLYLKAILNAYPEQWQSILEEVFIYSYFKCLLYAINSSRVASFPSSGQALAGHLIMYHFLDSIAQQFPHDGFTVVYKLKMSEEDQNYILAMAREFTWLSPYIVTTPRFFIEIERLDRILNNLKQDFVTTDPRLFQFSENSVMTYLTKDMFPIANSMYAKGDDANKWFYAYDKDNSFTDSAVLFGKACFFCSVDDNNINKFYDYNDQDDNYWLVKYEVTSICGSDYPNYIRIEPDVK